MKSIISTTFDDNYLFFLPITTWSWNKLGVDVICFMPSKDFNDKKLTSRFSLALSASSSYAKNTLGSIEFFECPENKEATYAQCSRLYAGALQNIHDDEILITSDIDMALFEIPPHSLIDDFTIFGADLVPNSQYPMCYISATKRKWNGYFDVGGKTMQQCLDSLLGDIDCENMRGNYWGKDQETAYDKISGTPLVELVERAKPGTQFATRRLDRDDAFLLERDMTDIIDFHLPRPGYEERNFEIILTVFKKKYPNEDFYWLVEYRNEYLKLL